MPRRDILVAELFDDRFPLPLAEKLFHLNGLRDGFERDLAGQFGRSFEVFAEPVTSHRKRCGIRRVRDDQQ